MYFELAGRTFQVALKKHPENAGLHYGAALAFSTSDMELMLAHLSAALQINPTCALQILLANSMINQEAY